MDAIKNHQNLDDLLFFAGSSCPELGKDIASHLNVNLGRMTVKRFSDGEISVELQENVRGKCAYILQSMSSPANDHIMELLLIADALRRASVSDIVAIVPYLGYSRQDRRPRSLRVPISARVVADIISVVGINRLLTMDLHAEQIQGFYQIPVENVYATPVLMGDMAGRADPNSAVIVSPDVGGVVRARVFASNLGLQLVIIDKRRPRANETKVMHIIGDVEGKDCFLVDDIVDTANTLCQAATALKQKGAGRVVAYCTHAVLSGGAVERVMESDLDELVVCNTIPADDVMVSCDKIRILTISGIVAEAIARIYQHGSLSTLF